MKLTLLRLLKMTMKFSTYGFLFQVFFMSMLMANTGSAQYKKANEIFIDQAITDYSVQEVFDLIEANSDFQIFFLKRDLKSKKKINLIPQSSRSVFDILMEVSKQSGFKFRQVNNVISATPISTKELNQSVKRVEIFADVDISGKITDENGEGLPGASIVHKGTTNGATSDLDGNYKLTLSEGATITVSFVGYLNQDIVVGSQSVIDVQMKVDANQLDEIVVIGYGTAKKKDLTGSVASVDGTQISDRNPIQISQALQGAMPGVSVTRGAGSAPGSSGTIRIRGITTLGDSNPLIIVDGVPVDDIDAVNVSDIENISVLKDAASASIYGSRAAAGVVIVTTKRAQNGNATFSYNAQYGIEKPTGLPQYTGPVRYMEMANELQWNDSGNLAGGEDSIFPQADIDSYLVNNRTNPDQYPITDWQEEVLKSHSTREAHEFSFSMGTGALSTKSSFKYENSDALWSHRNFERFTGRINNDLKINKYLSAQIDLSIRRTNLIQSIFNPMSRIRRTGPIYAARWSDGRVAIGKQGDNPWGQTEFGGTSKSLTDQLIGKIGIDFKPIEDLKISIVASPNITANKTKRFNKAVPTFAMDDPTVFDGYLSGHERTDLIEQRTETQRFTGQFLVNYTKTLGDHNIDLLTGYEQYSFSTEFLEASRINYVLQDFPYLNLGPQDARTNSGSAIENAYRSYFGRLMYDYKGRYLLQANMRRDGSSRFSPETRWGVFPSVSLGWIVSEESFLTEASWLSFLKLRGSWGQLGNERIGSYPYQSTIAFGDALFYQGSSVVSAITASQVDFAIRNVSWETTETVDIGIDAGFFDDRLTLTADYYKKKTKDMLLALEIPDFIGYGNPEKNTGQMETTGWEFQLGWRSKIGQVGYSISANLSDYKSVIGDLGGTEFLGSKIKTKGSEFDEWYGYVSDGIYQTQDEIDESAVLNSSVGPGDIKYLDLSGPEGVPDGIISAEYDRTLLGGSLPRMYYGGNIRLDYKNFDFSMDFQGVGKQLVRMNTDMIQPLINNATVVPTIYDGNYWSVNNSAEQNQSALYPKLSQQSSGANYTLSDRWLFSGAYFRLKNITLSYNLPKELVEKARLQNVRVYGSISDLFSIDNYPNGFDPEEGRSSGSNIFIYPVTTSFIMGLSLKF